MNYVGAWALGVLCLSAWAWLVFWCECLVLLSDVCACLGRCDRCVLECLGAVGLLSDVSECLGVVSDVLECLGVVSDVCLAGCLGVISVLV